MYLIQTVQTTWRPQLPLPKELQFSDELHNNADDIKVTTHNADNNNDLSQQQPQQQHCTNNPNDHEHQMMERLRQNHHQQNQNNNGSLSGSQQLTNKQKWSFGRLFRKKKEEVESPSSSEEDRKAGFVPVPTTVQQRQSAGSAGKSKTKASKSLGGGGGGRNGGSTKALGFDHIVMPPQQQQHYHHPPAASQPQQQQPHQHIDNEFFLPVETIEPYYQNQQQHQHQQYHQQQQQPPQVGGNYYNRSTNSLDRRLHTANAMQNAQRLKPPGGTGHSSEEELISLNSSTFSKYRSDESLQVGGQSMLQGAGQGGQSRRSRAARNERYYKRLSRDGEQSHGGIPQPMRWKTQPVPLSIYQPQDNIQQQQQQQQQQQLQHQRLRNTSSLQNIQNPMQYVHWQQHQQQQQSHQQPQQPAPQPPPSSAVNTKRSLQNTMQTDGKRSISYDSHIHLQPNMNGGVGRYQSKPLPPPPPPRDPLRRVQAVAGSQSMGHNGSANDLRPVSLAFDHQNVVAPMVVRSGLGNRCASDDRIWQSQMLPHHYQSVHSLNTPNSSIASAPVNHQQQQQGGGGSAAPHHRRYITRAERAAQPSKQSLPNGIDFHYVTDSTPRSRKPIHMMEATTTTTTPPPAPSTGILRTSKSGLPTPQTAPTAPTASAFWQRLDEGSTPRVPVAKPRSVSSSRVNELRSYPIPMYSEVKKPKRKPSTDDVDGAVVCGSLHISKPNEVEIRHRDVQQRTNSMPHHYQRRSIDLVPPSANKYEEYVAEKREQHQLQQQQAPISIPNPTIYFPRKKPANLEEAISELEAIYKSLGLTEPPETKTPPPRETEPLVIASQPPPPSSSSTHRVRVPTPSDFDKFAVQHADEYDDEDSPTGEPDPVRDDVAYRSQQLANLQYRSAADKQPPFGIPVGPIVPAPQSDYLHVEPIREPKKTGSPDIIKDDLAVRALRKDPPGPKPYYAYPTGAMQKKNRATRTQSANIYNLIQRDATKPSGGDLFSYMQLTRSIERAGSMSDLHRDEISTDTSDVPATLDLLRKLKAQDEDEVAMKKQKCHHNIPFRHPSQGGAIAHLPERLTSAETTKTPVPLPRKTLTPEPSHSNHQMEDALNKIAQDAQESSIKLSRELNELRKEALITAARPKLNAEQQKLEQELQEIEAVSEAARRCGKLLLDTLPDANEKMPQAGASTAHKLHKEGKLIKAIDEVSEAANAVCEKILKDIVTTEPPVIVQEAIQVKQTEQPLIMPNLIKKLDPIQSDKIEAIAKRCMRQLSELAETGADYDNLQDLSSSASSSAVVCNINSMAAVGEPHQLISTVAETAPVPVPAGKSTLSGPQTKAQAKAKTLEEIDKIMQECERQATATKHSDASTDDQRTTAPSMTSSSGSASGGCAPQSFSSSSDCLRSSSPTTNASRPLSSSITSFNPYSSSDYIKSPSSEYHAPSTDPIKTFSTTSYDVASTTATSAATTPNITTTTISTTTTSNSNSTTNNNSTNCTDDNNEPLTANVADLAKVRPPPPPSTTTTPPPSPSSSPPLNLTPVSHSDRGRSSSPSQYNSSEELAAIFGIAEQPRQQQQQKRKSSAATITTGNDDDGLIDAQNINATIITTVSSSTKTPPPTTTTTTTQMPSSSEAAYHVTNIASCAVPATLVQSSNTTNNNTTTITTTTTNDNNVSIKNVNIDKTVATPPPQLLVSPITITTIESSSSSSSCASNCSNHSYKLATIPEQEHDHDYNGNEDDNDDAHGFEGSTLKLSPNFNRIYASKVNIIVDTTEKVSTSSSSSSSSPLSSSSELVATIIPPPITLFDSLSSLEETSSNPDSGNVSLTDFPLVVTHANASMELQTSYNSRYEVKEPHYISEVSISEEFPPLPTEEELLESLREEDDDDDQLDATLRVPEIEENLSEDENRLEESWLKLTEGLEFEDESETISLNDVNYDNLTEKSEMEGEVDQVDGCIERKKSIIVYETPQINLSISELKLKVDDDDDDDEVDEVAQAKVQVFTTGDKHRVADVFTSGDGNDDADDEWPIDDTLPLNESSEEDATTTTTTNETETLCDAGLPASVLFNRRRFPSNANDGSVNNDDDDDDDNRPTTSSKALSIFGEHKMRSNGDDDGDGNGNAGGSVTALEHVFVACTVGLITPNDLLTLCLIIIGVIIIIAIALA